MKDPILEAASTAKRRQIADLRAEFPIGAQVSTSPSTDAWARGDRYGDVVKIGTRTGTVHVKLDCSGRTLRFQAHNIAVLGDWTPRVGGSK